MRAIVKRRPGPGLEVADVPKPKCGPTDVLIHVHHAGVCGTDLHIADWDEWARGRLKPPVVVGHEFAGEVAAKPRGLAFWRNLSYTFCRSQPLVAMQPLKPCSSASAW